MDLTETYLFLFADSFMAGLVLPITRASAFPAMLTFGGHNIYIISLVYATGIAAAAAVNWVFGKMLRLLKKDGYVNTNEKTKNIPELFKNYGHWFAILGFVPILGPILTVFTGVLQSNLKKVVLVVFVVNLVYAVAR